MTGDIFKSADWAREAEEKKRAGTTDLVKALTEAYQGLTAQHLRSWTPQQRDHVIAHVPAGCTVLSLGADHIGPFVVVKKADGTTEKLYAVRA